jgi:hypothetical protein
MPRKKSLIGNHSGRTDAGDTNDVKVERIGKVTIYKRGLNSPGGGAIHGDAGGCAVSRDRPSAPWRQACQPI